MIVQRANRIGLITGVPAEQEALLPARPRVTSSIGGLIINEITANLGGDSSTLVCCTPGIGKVNAATAAATLVAAHGVEVLAIIGTAGRIDPALEPGPYLITEAVQADYGAYRNGGFETYRAGSLPIGPPDAPIAFVSSAAAAIVAGDPTVPTARIATGDSFVEDDERSRSVAAATGAGLVDMETAAVAQAAERLGLDWLAVKAVSDDANADSAGDFSQQLARASHQAAELFERLYLADS